MPSNVTSVVDTTLRRMRRRQAVRAGCWAASAVCVAALLLTMLDAVATVHSLASRVVLTSAFLLVVAVALHRCWARFSRRLTPIELARQIDLHDPSFDDLVSSGYAFSRQDPQDPTAGSAELRRTVVVRASAALESWNAGGLLQRITTLRTAYTAAAAAIGLCIVLALMNPALVTAGVPRLLNPWSSAQWPRNHYLELVDLSQRLPAGVDLEVEVRDARGKLPHDVTVHFRTLRRGNLIRETLDLSTESGRTIARRPNVQAPFELRATGGDDRAMAWQRVDVVARPEVEIRDLVVEPPAYSGLPSAKTAPPIQCLAGSRIRIVARASEALAKAAIIGPQGSARELTIGPGGYECSTGEQPWSPTESGAYALRLTTANGLTAIANKRLMVDVIDDRPPTARIVAPADDLRIVPDAAFTVTIQSDDDLALRRVAFKVSEQTESGDAAEQVVLFEGPPESPPTQLPRAGKQAADVTTALNRQDSANLDLGQLDIRPGDNMVLSARAVDYAGQVGENVRPVRIHVISREESLRQSEAELVRLVDTLQRAHATQLNVRDQVGRWSSDAPTATEISAAEARSALAQQRQVAHLLIGGDDSVSTLTAELMQAAQQGGFLGSAAEAALSNLRLDLDVLSTNQLPTIDMDLSNVVRSIESAAGEATNQAAANPLSEIPGIVKRQDDVLDVLAAAIDQLARTAATYGFAEELLALAGDQRQLAEATLEFARDALQTDAASSRETWAKRQRQATSEQRQLAGRLTDAVSQIARAAENTSSRSDAAKLESVASQATASGVLVTQRDAADTLAAGQYVRSAVLQRDAANEISDLAALLLDRDKTTNAGAASPLREAERQISERSQPGAPTPSSNKPGQEVGSATAIDRAPIETDVREAVSSYLDQVWGRLPERQREQLLQPLSEQFLPEYAEDIRMYFRELAQPQSDERQP